MREPTFREKLSKTFEQWIGGFIQVVLLISSLVVCGIFIAAALSVAERPPDAPGDDFFTLFFSGVWGFFTETGVWIWAALLFVIMLVVAIISNFVPRHWIYFMAGATLTTALAMGFYIGVGIFVAAYGFFVFRDYRDRKVAERWAEQARLTEKTK